MVSNNSDKSILENQLQFNKIDDIESFMNEPEIKIYFARKRYEEETNISLKKENWKELFLLKKEFENILSAEDMCLAEKRKDFYQNTGMSFWPELMKCQLLSLERFLVITDRLFKESPFRFSIHLARLRRRSPVQYNYISLIVKNSPSYNSMKSDYAKVSMRLATQEYKLSGQAEVDELIDFFNRITINDLTVLFRESFYKNVQVLREFLDKLQSNDEDFCRIKYEGLYRLIVLSYAHLSEDKYINLLSKIKNKNLALTEVQPLSSPESIADLIAENTLRNSLVKSNKLFKKGTPLRIAICVSGQMRAYKEAFETWQHLNLEKHNVDFYVDTWSEVGFRFPDPISGNGANRIFGHNPFILAYMKAGALYGANSMYKSYPVFFEKIQSSSKTVTLEDLKSVYGENISAIIEDESELVFEDDAGNQKKMFYKIESANNQVIKSGKKYDLIIRIRPDKIINKTKKEIDWYEIANISNNKNILFSDPISVTNVLYMDDQFAVGSPSVMMNYSNTAKIQKTASNEKWHGFTRRLIAHRTLAYSLLYQGVLVRNFMTGKLGGMASTGLLTKEVILDLLLQDLPDGPKTNMDHLLIDSLV